MCMDLNFTDISLTIFIAEAGAGEDIRLHREALFSPQTDKQILSRVYVLVTSISLYRSYIG